MRSFYHVTSAAVSVDILQEGFLPGWGDAGLGVYLFDDLSAAEAYTERNGWDGALLAPVILEILSDCDQIIPVIPDPAWPDPESYEHVHFLPCEDEDVAWQPRSIRLLRDASIPGLDP